jgi:hypothetical protein
VSLKNSSEEFLGITVNRYGKEEETKDRVKKCILVNIGFNVLMKSLINTK